MSPRYTNEFKEEAAKQILENGYPIKETVERLGHPQSLIKWVKQYRDPLIHAKKDSRQQEILKLKKELKQVTEERDILKKAAVYFAKQQQS